MVATAEADAIYEIVSTALDQAFYRSVYPERVRPGFDPVRDYLEGGWREGRDPAPWFSVRRYLETHGDIAQAGLEPLSHYLRHGAQESRAVFESAQAAVWRRAGGASFWTFDPPPPAGVPAAARPRVAEPAAAFTPAERDTVAAEFDAAFYLDNNPDLVEAGCDPLEHFLVHGWREGRDPAPWFSVAEYLSDNPDIVAAKINPFLHYLLAGRAEGRAPRSTLGFRYRIIAGLSSLETRIEAAEERASLVELAPDVDFLAALAESRTGLKDLHLTFSHDDFTAHVGGVQLCLQVEGARMAERGRDHLHLCPATPWPVLRRGQPAALSAVLNGRNLGAFASQAIVDGLSKARSGGVAQGSFAIHNLLGHDVDEVLRILQAAGLKDGFFWLHDFTSLCAGYQLLRNDVQDCGAPPPNSAACGVCLYGPGRMPQVADHERLFSALSLTVVSPAQTTLEFWRSSWSFPTAGEVVHPHVRLVPRAAAPEPPPRRLRLAFLGMPSAHKGWPIFAELAADFAGDDRYEFLHLGVRRDPRSALEHHPVSVSLAEPRAMQQALERLEVDVAVIWSIFRETFCFAAYEAAAAGCAIVTSPDSANVAAFVESGADGRVLADEAALRQALASGELLDLARRVRKPRLSDLEFSGMTADLVKAEVRA